MNYSYYSAHAALVKNYWPELVLGLLLAVSFLIRSGDIYRPEIENADEFRDYSAAHLVLKGEYFPLVGPPHSLYGDFFNSPFYYYFLSIFLKVEDNLFFLRFVNVGLQLFSIFFIYLLGKKLFSPAAGFIAAVLFSFSLTNLLQSHEVWQSHIMHPFLVLSYLFLWFAYEKKSYLYLLCGIFIFVLAVAIHTPPLFILPAFLALAVFILFLQKTTPFKYVGVAGFAAASFAFFYGPVIYAIFQSGVPVASPASFPGISFLSAADAFVKFFYNLSLLANAFFLNAEYIFPSAADVLIMTLVLSGIVYFQKEKEVLRRNYMLVLIFAVLQLLSAAALLRNDTFTYHLAPAFSLFVLVISGIVDKVFSGGFFKNSVKVLLVAALVWSFSGGLSFLKDGASSYYPRLRWTNTVDYRF